MSPATLARIIRLARIHAFDRESDPDRCPRIIGKVLARCPVFKPSGKLQALELELERRWQAHAEAERQDNAAGLGGYRGERSFKASEARVKRIRGWEARHVLPLREKEKSEWRASPGVLPYHRAGIL